MKLGRGTFGGSTHSVNRENYIACQRSGGGGYLNVAGGGSGWNGGADGGGGDDCECRCLAVEFYAGGADEIVA